MSYESLYNLYYKNKELYKSIYDNRKNSENTIKFNFKINNNEAFIFLHKDILKMVNIITTLDKKVEQLLKDLPHIARENYIKKSLIDEIVCTNEIEGIISTRKQINEVISDIESKVKKKNRFYSLVQKYMLLMTDKFKELDSPFNIREIYDELVLDEIISHDINDIPDGVIFREKQVEVKSRSGKVLHEGVLPESKIISLINQGINIVNDKTIEPLIRIAIFHYLFSYVHPFYDGNGRTNRYISSLYLKNYFNPIISYRLSLSIKENIRQYYDSFDKTNSKINLGDMSTFVYEFIDIVYKSFLSTIDYLEKKKSELDNIESLIKGLGLEEEFSSILFILSQIELFGGTGMNPSQIENVLGISRPTCAKRLKKLMEKDLIISYKDGKFNYYVINLAKFDM